MTRVRSALAFRKIGAIYVLVVICVVFTIWIPDTFPKLDTLRQVANGNGVTALAALAIIVPLSAGVFDISCAYTMSLSGVLTAYIVIHTSLPLGVAVALALVASALVGVVNGFVVVTMRIESLIGTLATGSLIQALITLITKDQSLNSAELVGPFAKIATNDVDGFTYPVFYAIGVALILWIILDHAVVGRRLYATGFNQDAARLAGIRTARLRFASLVVSSTLAGAAGIVLASSIGGGSPTAGTPYLLSSFAAVFLGATQLKEGRFNAWGTLIAVALLGVGVTGLGLAGTAAWTGSTFTGVVLITALAVTGVQRRDSIAKSRWRNLGRRRAEPAAGPADEPRDWGDGSALEIGLVRPDEQLLDERT
jgi:ribose/xylose/arabinose/galactoside ABC-type transport system permease subunit